MSGKETEIPKGYYPWEIDFPVYVLIFPDWYGTPQTRTMESGATGLDCLLVFTDEDLAERHIEDAGWTEVEETLKINTVQELHQHCQQFPAESFSGIVFDMWKGNAKCQMTREELRRIARELDSRS